MNISSAIRKPRLILAVLAAAASLAAGAQLVLSQEAPPTLSGGPGGAPKQVGPPGAVGRPDGPGRGGPDGFGPGPRGFGRGPDGAGRGGPRGARRGPGGPPGTDRLDRPGRPIPLGEAVQLSGTVTNYNFGPWGTVEALMIKTSDKTIQVNLPPPLAPFATQVAAVGASVNLTAYPEMGLPDHPVYELASIKNEQGRELRQPTPEDRKFVHEEGTVKTLNYARHGEVNGAILENGDFVHLGPATASVKLAVGQKITVDGVGHPMLMSEHHAVDVLAIDGKMLEPADRPGAQGGPQGDGPGMRGGPPGDGPQGPRRVRGWGRRGNGPGGPPPPPQPGRGGEDFRPPPSGKDDSENQFAPDEQLPPIEP